MEIGEDKQKAIGKITACFKAILGKDLDMDSFEDRIRLQKILYILERAGIRLGYSFGWHIRGPYSPHLADDGYAYKENKGKMAFSYAFGEGEKRIIARVQGISEYLETEEHSELLASLLYLSKRLELEGEKLKEELKVRKPRFSDAEIDEALSYWDKIRAGA